MAGRWLDGKICIALPQDEYERIRKHPEIKWGAVARKAVIQYLEEYEKFLETKDQSKQSESDKTKGSNT